MRVKRIESHPTSRSTLNSRFKSLVKSTGELSHSVGSIDQGHSSARHQPSAPKDPEKEHARKTMVPRDTSPKPSRSQDSAAPQSSSYHETGLKQDSPMMSLPKQKTPPVAPKREDLARSSMPINYNPGVSLTQESSSPSRARAVSRSPKPSYSFLSSTPQTVRDARAVIEEYERRKLAKAAYHGREGRSGKTSKSLASASSSRAETIRKEEERRSRSPIEASPRDIPRNPEKLPKLKGDRSRGSYMGLPSYGTGTSPYHPKTRSGFYTPAKHRYIHGRPEPFTTIARVVGFSSDQRGLGIHVEFDGGISTSKIEHSAVGRYENGFQAIWEYYEKLRSTNKQEYSKCTSKKHAAFYDYVKRKLGG